MLRPVSPQALAGVGLALVALLVTPLFAAVQGGTLQSVDPDTGRLVIESSTGKKTTFNVPASADVRIDGKKAGLDKLEPGQTVSVTTSRTGTVTRVSAREAVAKPAKTSPAKSDPEEQTPTEQPAGRTARTANREKSDAAGWTQFRGPDRANRSSESGLLAEWGPSGPERTWTAQGLGEGYSTVVLADGVLYTMGTEERAEVVIALSLETGDTSCVMNRLRPPCPPSFNKVSHQSHHHHQHQQSINLAAVDNDLIYSP
jgi:hypothetical protein